MGTLEIYFAVDESSCATNRKHEGFSPGGQPQKTRHDNASTGFGAATMRVLTARFLAFYFRAPIKAFFRSRVDYMGYARAINPRVQAGEAWTWRMTSPALLASAVQRHGWSFLPNQVLPPMLANTVVGAVLYTAYLQTLGKLHEPSARPTKRVDPLPPPSKTLAAGFIAGSIQSLLAGRYRFCAILSVMPHFSRRSNTSKGRLFTASS